MSVLDYLAGKIIWICGGSYEPCLIGHGKLRTSWVIRLIALSAASGDPCSRGKMWNQTREKGVLKNSSAPETSIPQKSKCAASREGMHEISVVPPVVETELRKFL